MKKLILCLGLILTHHSGCTTLAKEAPKGFSVEERTSEMAECLKVSKQTTGQPQPKACLCVLNFMDAFLSAGIPKDIVYYNRPAFVRRCAYYIVSPENKL
jgi:hypothetical protein